MRQLITFFIILFSFSAYSQYVRFDSTVIHQNRLIYNNAGYYIGKDSLHTKRVRLVFCSDTVPVDYDTLILRTPQRFITMDSVTGSSCPECGVPIDDLNDSLNLYLKRSENDTIFGWLYLRDHLTTTPMIKLESGIDPYILDIGANNGILIGKSTGSATTAIFNDHISIERYAEYTPTFDSDVSVQSEIKDLISDSIATRPTLATVRNEISDSLSTVSSPDLSGYVKSNANDTITGYYTLWKDTGNEAKVTNNMISVTDGTNTAMIQPSQYYITDGADKGASMTPDGTTINDANTGASNTAYANHIEITRAGYAATAANEVPIVSEVKALINDSLDTRLASYSTTTQMRGEINDSLDTRLASYTPNGDLEEKIQDQIGTKLVQGTNITLSYNDATGETTVDAAGASGLSAENVFDTLAYSIRMGEGLKKTKSDTGDSLLIEFKLRDIESIAYKTASHKWINMPSNLTSGGTVLGAVWSAAGTNTSPTKATTTIHTFMNRAEILRTTNSTTNLASLYSASLTHGFGNVAGMGGFYYHGVFGPATGCSNTTHRGFFGMRGSVALPSDVDPSTLTNVFGIAWDDDDSNVQFMHNDASGTCTKVDLGSNFPVATADRTNVYRLYMYAEPNTTTVYYKVVDLTDGDVYVGSATTNLPSNTQMFCPAGIMSVGGTNTICGISLFQLEIFSDF